MARTLVITGVAVLCAAVFAGAAEVEGVRGKVEAVTVYRGQALVTRVVEVPGPAGLREVVVTDLPAHVEPASIFAESANGIEVRSVRYRVQPVADDTREEVRAIEHQIREVQDRIHANQQHLQLAAERKAYLDKLEQFVAPTATAELTSGVLNAETIRDLTVFLDEHRKALTDGTLRLTIEQRDLNERLALLQRQRQELAGASARTVREAVVFVNLQEPGGRLRVSYLVNNATWAPSYNLRAREDGVSIQLEYNALIEQMSGEAWDDVAMTLSTATPSLVAKAPPLVPLTLALSRGTPDEGRVLDDISLGERYEAERDRLISEQERLMAARNTLALRGAAQSMFGMGGMGGAGQTRRTDAPSEESRSSIDGLTLNAEELNRLAAVLQQLDLVSKPTGKRGGGEEPRSREEVTVVYELSSRLSLPSRSDRQLIQVASVTLPAEFFKIATPVLTSYVYNEAAVSNDSEFVFLAGPVATYFNGQFVGHGTLPTVSVGEHFTAGFGIDPSLRAVRELLDREETFQGGNRVLKLVYRLSVENFGRDAAQVRIIDRIPQTSNEIKVTLVSSDEDLSTDPSYRQTDHKKGMLRWEVDVPARSAGIEAMSMDYAVRLEYDRQMTVTGTPLASAQ